jgi:hypothetical protein
VGVEDRTDKSDDNNQFDGMPPFAVEVDPSIPSGNEETPYLRHDLTKELSSKKETSILCYND